VKQVFEKGYTKVDSVGTMCIISLIQTQRLELVESAYQSLVQNKELYPDLSPDVGRELFIDIFHELEKVINLNRGDARQAMLRVFSQTFKMHPQIRDDIAAQTAIVLTTRWALNSVLSGSDNLDHDDFDRIQQTFDFCLSAFARKFQDAYTKRLQEDRRLIEQLKIVKNDQQRQLNIIYQIIRESPIGMIDCDVNLRVQHWNPMAMRLTGYSAADVLNQDVASIFDEGSRTKIMGHFSSDRKWIPNLKLMMHKKTGETFPVLVCISKIKENNPGEIFYVIAFHELSDDSAIKSYKDRVERLSSIASLSAAMMHDIRNPLNSISLNLDLLKESIENGVPMTAGKFSVILNRTHVQIGRITESLSQYMTFTRLAEIKLTRLNLAFELAAFVDEMRVDAVMRGNKLEFSSPKKSALIRGDWIQLRRVFGNILENAVHALSSRENGQIQIDMYLRRERLVVTIKDNGPGLRQTEIEKLYEPFFTTKQHGSGLGLFIAKEITIAHNGRISCTSRLGEGAQFTVSFPLIRENPDHE
jgi:PAS domain S-box-containing protein